MGVFNALVSGSFLPWKRTKRETDYESVLAGLDHDIQDVQTRLTQIRRRQRRASVTLTLQAVLLWIVYTGICWLLGLLVWPLRGRIAVWTPVLVSPLLIFSVRRIVKWWYKRIGAAEDKHLVDLKRQKRDKIDELKRATKYDHLRMLLDKYDDAAATASPARKTSAPQTPQKASPGPPPGPPPGPQPGPPPDAQRMAMMRAAAQLPPQARARIPPPHVLPKTWMDKLADAVLGADPAAVGPEQKYALICSKCHAHNGLALREEFNEVQYICPLCGHFNTRRPSSAPISSPFKSQPALETTPETPSKVPDSKLKLRADDSDSDSSDNTPPTTLLQEEHDTRRRSLRARAPKTSDNMDLDE